MAVEDRLFFELKGLMTGLQVKLRPGLKMQLSGPTQAGCAECLLIVFELGEGVHENAGSPPGSDPVLSIRIPLSAALSVQGRHTGRRREFQVALAEAFSEFSMSSGLGLSAADWSSVVGLPVIRS